jgi:hypothetical protein
MIAYFQFLGRTAFSALRLISALDDDTTQVSASSSAIPTLHLRLQLHYHSHELEE